MGAVRAAGQGNIKRWPPKKAQNNKSLRANPSCAEIRPVVASSFLTLEIVTFDVDVYAIRVGISCSSGSGQQNVHGVPLLFTSGLVLTWYW